MPTRGNEGDARAAIVGRDPRLLAAVAAATRVAPTALPVLVSGETGTGKELFARLIHERSGRRDRPLVTVNCGALSRELADSELFGHERGAFTGAGSRRAGWFEEADGGTLVLDEIGELPLELQPRLLRALETGRIRRLGGRGEIAVDVRVVACTLRDLGRDVARGAFRADLFHRLAGLEVTLPPLRDRAADVPLLVDSFWRRRAQALAGGVPCQLEAAAIQRLMMHAWPGNVRELRNVLARVAILCEGAVGAEDIDRCLGATGPMRTEPAESDDATASMAKLPVAGSFPGRMDQVVPRLADGPPTLVAGAESRHVEHGPDHVRVAGKSFAQIEREVLDWALGRSGGNRRGAARVLAMARSTFNDRARRLGILS